MLTLFAIVKDSECSLPGMIESAKDIVDRIVIVDTGSSDNTLEVARRYTDDVLVHPRAEEWKADKKTFSFAEARNWGLDHCPDGWILMLDCDERLREGDGDKVLKLIDEAPESMDLYLLTMVMCRDDGSPYQQFLAERLFRNLPHMRFTGHMHNHFSLPDDNGKAAAPEVEIIHNRAVKSESSREERTGQRLEMAEHYFIEAIERDPDDRRSMFYLAGTYFDSQQLERAMPWLERYLTVSDWNEERYQAGILLAQCYIDKDRHDDARVVLSRCLTDNWRRAEALLLLGEIAEQAGDTDQAECWYKIASLKPMPVDPLFVEHEAHTWVPHFKLYRLYKATGRPEKARPHARTAMELGCPEKAEIIKFDKDTTLHASNKIAVLADRGQLDFIQPVIDHWRAQGKTVQVTDNVNQAESLYHWADIVWCEWAGDLAAKVTSLPKKPRVIVRVHGYETHTGQLEVVNWAHVDDAIFVADYLRDLAIEQVPELAQLCNVYTVPGGVECSKFDIAGGKTGNKIAAACYGNTKKQFPLMLQILAKCPGKELHIATSWQDHRLAMYVEHAIAELGLTGRVFFHPWQEDLNAFYKDKDYYLSASMEESFHYALAEAMAAGLKPVIHCWRSAYDFYRPEWIFRTVDEAAAMINCQPTWKHGGKRQAQEYRRYACDNLDISCNLRRIDRIITKPKVSIAGQPRHEFAAEYKIGHMLQSLGCDMNAENPDVVIAMGHTPRVEPWMEGKRLVFWTSEAYGGDSPHVPARMEAAREFAPKCELVAVQQEQWKPVIEELGATRVECIPVLGACYPFGTMETPKVYDVGFYGAINDRRDKVLDELGEHFNVGVADTFDHRQLTGFINQCRVMVNIHYSDTPYTETRLGECMAAGACVVSEPLPEDSPYPKDCYVETDDLVETIKSLLSDEAKIRQTGARAHRYVWSELTLAGQAEKLLEALGL